MESSCSQLSGLARIPTEFSRPVIGYGLRKKGVRSERKGKISSSSFLVYTRHTHILPI